MNLEDVLNKAILAYFDGEELGETNKSGSAFKYTKKYFDEADERILPKDSVKDEDDD